MKAMLRLAAASAVRSNLLWKILDNSVLALSYRLHVERSRFKTEQATHAAVTAHFANMTVNYGPFRGMQYPAIRPYPSAFVAKLLGLYEHELAVLTEDLCTSGYSEIINIGCAEGYYAVGFARRCRSAQVFAYDINEAFQANCRLLAKLNSVSDRVHVAGFCTPQMLLSTKVSNRALVLSDCEGYEKKLFTAESVSKLLVHDVLIEVHDCFDSSISRHLKEAFADTHDLSVVSTVDDLKKAIDCAVPELQLYSVDQRRELLGEHRAAGMEWYFFRRRVSS